MAVSSANKSTLDFNSCVREVIYVNEEKNGTKHQGFDKEFTVALNSGI